MTQSVVVLLVMHLIIGTILIFWDVFLMSASSLPKLHVNFTYIYNYIRTTLKPTIVRILNLSEFQEIAHGQCKQTIVFTDSTCTAAVLLKEKLNIQKEIAFKSKSITAFQKSFQHNYYLIGTNNVFFVFVKYSISKHCK